jgi:predicted enzyme related to lactoylglutathione lyase
MRVLPSIPKAAVCTGSLLWGGLQLNGAEKDQFPPLNEPPTAERLAGKFIWADLFTIDPTAAVKFYEGMFGWTATTFAREGRTYLLLMHDSRPVAGIVQRPPGRASPAPGRWVGYVAVPDMAGALAGVTNSGGKVLAPAREFPRRGTQAIIADQDGAVLGMLQSASGDPPDFQAEIGEWIWTELFAKQPDAASTFYRRVFNYEVTVAPAAEKKDRFVLAASGFARAGISPLPAGEDARPAWLGFVRVENTDRAASQASALGGRVLVTPRQSPLGSRFAVLADPVGAAIAVIEFNAPINPDSSR